MRKIEIGNHETLVECTSCKNFMILVHKIWSLKKLLNVLEKIIDCNDKRFGFRIRDQRNAGD